MYVFIARRLRVQLPRRIQLLPNAKQSARQLQNRRRLTIIDVQRAKTCACDCEFERSRSLQMKTTGFLDFVFIFWIRNLRQPHTTWASSQTVQPANGKMLQVTSGHGQGWAPSKDKLKKCVKMSKLGIEGHDNRRAHQAKYKEIPYFTYFPNKRKK